MSRFEDQVVEKVGRVERGETHRITSGEATSENGITVWFIALGRRAQRSPVQRLAELEIKRLGAHRDAAIADQTFLVLDFGDILRSSRPADRAGSKQIAESLDFCMLSPPYERR